MLWPFWPARPVRPDGGAALQAAVTGPSKVSGSYSVDVILSAVSRVVVDHLETLRLLQ